MDHIGDRADSVERIKAVHCLRCVWHTDRHAITLADAEGVKRTGSTINALQKIGIGSNPIHEFVGWKLRRAFCGLCNHLVHCQARTIDMLRCAAVVFEPGSRRRN